MSEAPKRRWPPAPCAGRPRGAPVHVAPMATWRPCPRGTGTSRQTNTPRAKRGSEITTGPVRGRARTSSTAAPTASLAITPRRRRTARSLSALRAIRQVDRPRGCLAPPTSAPRVYHLSAAIQIHDIYMPRADAPKDECTTFFGEKLPTIEEYPGPAVKNSRWCWFGRGAIQASLSVKADSTHAPCIACHACISLAAPVESSA